MDTKTKFGVASIACFVIAILIFALSYYTVPAGFVGVVTRFGAVRGIALPGVGLKIPLIDSVHRMDCRTLKDQQDTSAASKDLQTVTATVAANYHLDPSRASDVYQSVGINYADIVIGPALQNIFKATTARYTAEQLIQDRDTVRLEAENSLRTQLAQYHVILDNFLIVNFDFSPEFNAAIEAKQVAQQQVETAKQNLAKAQVDAQAAVAQAQGQADAQKALKDTGALSPEYLQFLALQKWDGHLPSVTGGAVPFVPVQIVPTPQP